MVHEIELVCSRYADTNHFGIDYPENIIVPICGEGGTFDQLPS